MTAIAGLIHRGRVYLAGDSAISDEHGDVIYTTAPKVWLTPAGLAVGAAGDVPYLDALARVDWPARLEDAGATLRAALGTHEGSALIGWRGALYYLADHGTILPLDDTIAAAGSASGYIMGALAMPSARSPESRVRAAIEIASRYSAGVGGRVTVVHT